MANPANRVLLWDTALTPVSAALTVRLEVTGMIAIRVLARNIYPKRWLQFSLLRGSGPLIQIYHAITHRGYFFRLLRFCLPVQEPQMKKQVIAMIALLVLAYFGGNAYKKGQAELSSLAEKNGLSEEETAAFKSCTQDMSRKTLSLDGPSGKLKISRIPREICICHSRTMVKVFKNNRYIDHGGVVDYLVDRKKIPELDSNDLKFSGIGNEAHVLTLTSSIYSCSAKFHDEYTKKTQDELKKLKKT
ncbi:MAG: hypothetical protein H7X89_15095 [Rhizobiales bacterium]|nr:hypothetical protein [Hyphomicrobiales bacterium]